MNESCMKQKILNNMIKLKAFSIEDLYITLKQIEGNTDKKLSIIDDILSTPLIEQVFDIYIIKNNYFIDKTD